MQVDPTESIPSSEGSRAQWHVMWVKCWGIPGMAWPSKAQKLLMVTGQQGDAGTGWHCLHAEGMKEKAIQCHPLGMKWTPWQSLSKVTCSQEQQMWAAASRPSSAAFSGGFSGGSRKHCWDYKAPSVQGQQLLPGDPFIWGAAVFSSCNLLLALWKGTYFCPSSE